MSIRQNVRDRNFPVVADKIIKYIEFSKKFSSTKSQMLIGIFDAVSLVSKQAISQEEFNSLEEVYFELVKLDPNLYEARVWLARALSDNDIDMSMVNINKAIEISPSRNEAYREAIRIFQKQKNQQQVIKYCSKYMSSQLGGQLPRNYRNFFWGNELRKIAVNFSLDGNRTDLKFYTHTGVELNRDSKYEFIPESPIDVDGINLYFSFLPGIKVGIKELQVFSSDGIKKIPAKNLFASSESSYLISSQSGLNFITNGGNEVIRLNYDEVFKSIEKIIITINIEKLAIINDNFCKEN